MKTKKINRPPPGPTPVGRSGPTTAPRRRKGERRTGEKYILRLFVAGATARSQQAVLRVRELCATELQSGCSLQVIDIYQQPELARRHQIIATPTLIMAFPKPVRRFIGNLANTAALRLELDVTANVKAGL